MKRQLRTRVQRQFTAFVLAALLGGLLSFSIGCSKQEKEKEPVVSVQTMPAQRSAISQVASAEAVVFPLQQAVIAPKITSTITAFQVQRGSRVKKGQLLAVLENKDLAAAAEASKGDLDQAEAALVHRSDRITGAGALRWPLRVGALPRSLPHELLPFAWHP